MNGFPYTNPYSQSQANNESSMRPSSLDSVLSALDSNNLSQLVKVGCETRWSVQQMNVFVEWIFARWQNPRSNDDESSMWLAIWQITQTWSPCLVYAAAVYQSMDHDSAEETCTFVDILYDRIIDFAGRHEENRNTMLTPAIAATWMVLSYFCRVLDRCCELCCNTNLTHDEKSQYSRWFIRHGRILHDFSMRGLRIRPDEWNSMINKHALDLCDFKTACTQILELLCDSSSDAFDFISSIPQDFNRKLLQEATRLNDVQMPPSSFSLFSLSCLRLLIIKNHHDGDRQEEEKLAQFLNSTSIISYVIAAVIQYKTYDDNFDDSGDELPCWTSASQPTETFAALSTLRALYYHYSSTFIANAIAKHPGIPQYLENVWKKVLHSPSKTSSSDKSCTVEEFETLIFLHEACRNLTRQVTQQLISDNSASNCNKHVLMHLMDDSVRFENRLISLESVVLLKILLADRIYESRHDEFSRSLWPLPQDLVKAIAESTYEMAASCQKSQYYCKNYYYYYSPILLVLLEIGHILIKLAPEDAELYNSIISSMMHAKMVESLVEMALPKRRVCLLEANPSFTQADADQPKVMNRFGLDDDQSTPPLNNLSSSRLDVSTLVDETEQSIPPRGIDLSLRLAAATLLAVVGQMKILSPETNRNAIILQNRATSAANEYAADSQWCYERDIPYCPNIGHRRLRLLTVLAAAPDNERYMAGLVHASVIANEGRNQKLRETLHFCQQELQGAIEREKQCKAEKDKLLLRLNTLEVAQQRKKSELQRHAAWQSKQLVDIHVAERKKAETHCRELAKHMAEAQNTAISCREAEAHVRSMLEDVTSKLKEMSANEGVLIKRAEASENELHHVTKDLRAAEKSLTEITHKAKEMQNQIHIQVENMTAMEESHSQLRESLENLFGDMVSLAQLYEAMEKQQSMMKERSDEQVEMFQKRLETERQRNAELEERERRICHENEILTKKYRRAKERLEQEQSARVREAEQRRKRATGPVSYINQLHMENSKVYSSTIGKENGSVRSSQTR